MFHLGKLLTLLANIRLGSKFLSEKRFSISFPIICDDEIEVDNVDTPTRCCAGNTEGGSITVLLTSCLTGLELAV